MKISTSIYLINFEIFVYLIPQQLPVATYYKPAKSIINNVSIEHPINQLSGKITAFQGVNALGWQQQIRKQQIKSKYYQLPITQGK